MAFGARSEDGWRLCHRKGRTILNVWGKPSVFKSQAKAKACADELNELFWSAYWKCDRKGEVPPADVFWGMIDTIAKHGGLTADQVKEIEQE